MRGLSLVVASGGHSSSRCAGLSLSRPLLLWSTGSRRAGSVVVAHGPSCSAACGILPDQGSNLCPLHWQADPQPLRHQGSPKNFIFIDIYIISSAFHFFVQIWVSIWHPFPSTQSPSLTFLVVLVCWPWLIPDFVHLKMSLFYLQFLWRVYFCWI